MTTSNGNISILLALCEGDPWVTCGFPSQRPVTWSFDVFFDLCLYLTVEQTIKRAVIWDTIMLIMTSLWCWPNISCIWYQPVWDQMMSMNGRSIDMILVAVDHIEALAKWLMFCRQLFRIQFLESRSFYLIQILMLCIHKDPVHNWLR